MLKNAIIRRVSHMALPVASVVTRHRWPPRDSELVTVDAVLLTEIATAAGGPWCSSSATRCRGAA
jgi:hypothetical protein